MISRYEVLYGLYMLGLLTVKADNAIWTDGTNQFKIDEKSHVTVSTIDPIQRIPWWAPIGDLTADKIAVSRTWDGRYMIFGIATENNAHRVFYTQQDKLAGCDKRELWNPEIWRLPWHQLGDATAEDISVGYNGRGDVYVVVIGTGPHNVLFIWNSQGFWRMHGNSWFQMGDLTGTKVLVRSNPLDAFAIATSNANGDVFHCPMSVDYWYTSAWNQSSPWIRAPEFSKDEFDPPINKIVFATIPRSQPLFTEDDPQPPSINPQPPVIVKPSPSTPSTPSPSEPTTPAGFIWGYCGSKYGTTGPNTLWYVDLHVGNKNTQRAINCVVTVSIFDGLRTTQSDIQLGTIGPGATVLRSILVQMGGSASFAGVKSAQWAN